MSCPVLLCQGATAAAPGGADEYGPLGGAGMAGKRSATTASTDATAGTPTGAYKTYSDMGPERGGPLAPAEDDDDDIRRAGEYGSRDARTSKSVIYHNVMVTLP